LGHCTTALNHQAPQPFRHGSQPTANRLPLLQRSHRTLPKSCKVETREIEKNVRVLPCERNDIIQKKRVLPCNMKK